MPTESFQKPELLYQHQLDAAVLNLETDKLKPEVKSYLENLISQARGILKVYDGKLDTAPIEVLQNLQSLITKLKHVAKTKEIPSEDNLVFKHTTAEGKEVILDCARILQESHAFYQEHNLTELANELPKSIKLSPEAKKRIKEALEQGFDKAMFFPSAELLTANRDKIIEECVNEPLPGLSETNQYDSLFSDGITRTSTSHNRPIQKHYLLFYTATIPTETKGKPFPYIEDLFRKKGWNGLTLDEYLILQRKECKESQDHQFDWSDPDPVKSKWNFLLDAHTHSNSGISGRGYAYWHPSNRRVHTLWDGPNSRDLLMGAYPSMIVEVE